MFWCYWWLNCSLWSSKSLNGWGKRKESEGVGEISRFWGCHVQMMSFPECRWGVWRAQHGWSDPNSVCVCVSLSNLSGGDAGVTRVLCSALDPGMSFSSDHHTNHQTVSVTACRVDWKPSAEFFMLCCSPGGLCTVEGSVHPNLSS